MPEARRFSYTIAFRIKVIAEAEAVENSSEMAILSGKLKMSAKRAKIGRFTPKCPELDEQAME